MIKVNGVPVEPTRFPDKTSQVWHLPEEIVRAGQIMIDWRFEREDELLSICQLLTLFKAWDLDGTTPVVVKVPYLPYARQDKPISNDATFALATFASMIGAFTYTKLVTWDVHNPDLTAKLIPNMVNVQPAALHAKLVKDLEIKTIIFPDAGAKNRYSWFEKDNLDIVVYAKKRDQATGKILGLERVKGTFADEAPCLIVDDICDGGATFLGIHESMKAEGLRHNHDLHLFVTHGIFSKGRKILEDAGIKLWTTNSVPANEGGMEMKSVYDA